jgi:hypothetical protein
LCTSVSPAHRRLWQKNHEFEAILDYKVRPCLKNGLRTECQSSCP